MGTQLCTIRDYIRAAVQDYDSNFFIYSDAALNQQINLTILTASFDPNNPAVPVPQYNQDSSGNFLIDLNPQQKMILSLQTAINLLAGKPLEFSYRSPAFSATRKNDRELLIRLEGFLDMANGGRFALETDTDFNAIVQGFDRYVNDYDRALSAWTGVPPL